MPNGKPGDHPLTDIVKHRLETFGAELDEKVRQIDAVASDDLRDVLATLVYFWPWEKSGLVSPHGLSAVLDSLARYAAKRRR
jgi:hypothetical protein